MELTTTLLTKPETAQYLRVPEETLRHWRDKRTGPLWIKVGRHVMYRREDLDDWLAGLAESARRDRDALPPRITTRVGATRTGRGRRSPAA